MRPLYMKMSGAILLPICNNICRFCGKDGQVVETEE